jgi:hypothetical protein
VKRKWLLMTEEAPSGEETTAVEVSEARRKCIMLHVLIAVQRLRYLSNLTPKDRFIVESVFRTTGNPERTAINN